MKARTSLKYLIASALLVACGGSEELSDSDAAEDVVGDVPQQDGATDAETPPEDSGQDADEVGDDVADTREDTGSDVSDIEEPDADSPDTADATDVIEVDGSDAVDAVDADDVDGGVAVVGSIAGTVHVALTAQTVPVVGATVRAGGVTATTDAAGRFVLSGVDASVPARVDVSVDAPDSVFSSSSRMVAVPAGDVTRVSFELIEGCAATVDVSSASGVVLPSDCGALDGLAGIELPANGVVDEEGTPVSEVRVVMVPMPLAGGETGASEAMRVFPGDMSARTSLDEDVTLESRGAVEVRLSDPVTGRPLQLAAGATATIMFPALSDSLDDEEVGSPLWWYDEETGVWNQLPDATTTIEVEPFGDRLMHRAVVPHFTWWNADRVLERTCITGRLVDTEGAPLGAQAVVAAGVDYLGTTRATTDTDGRFNVFARSNSSVELSASVERGVAQVGVRRSVTTLSDETTCADLGDIVVDVASIAACASGRVLDIDSVTPAAGAEVVASNGRQLLRTVSGADGTFCLPVPSGERYELAARLDSDEGRRIGRIDGLVGVNGSGVCGPAGDGCTELGDVVLRAPACLRGIVADAAGTVPSGTVYVAGRRGGSFAVSEADGSWCVQMEKDEVVDVLVRQLGFSGQILQAGASLDVVMPSSAGTCASLDGCLFTTVVIGERGCVSGVVETDAGEPLANARVLVSASDGRDPVRVATDASGRFCAPTLAGSTTRLDVQRVNPGVRFAATSVVNVPEGPASCALDTCVDVGVVRAVGVSASTCVRGRLLDGAPRPFRRTATLLSDAGQQAIRPEPSGEFCVELPASSSITLLDDSLVGCDLPRQSGIITEDAPSASCATPTACFDVGTVDFADFCFGS